MLSGALFRRVKVPLALNFAAGTAGDVGKIRSTVSQEMMKWKMTVPQH